MTRCRAKLILGIAGCSVSVLAFLVSAFFVIITSIDGLVEASGGLLFIGIIFGLMFAKGLKLIKESRKVEDE